MALLHVTRKIFCEGKYGRALQRIFWSDFNKQSTVFLDCQITRCHQWNENRVLGFSSDSVTNLYWKDAWHLQIKWSANRLKNDSQTARFLQYLETWRVGFQYWNILTDGANTLTSGIYVSIWKSERSSAIDNKTLYFSTATGTRCVSMWCLWSLFKCS